MIQDYCSTEGISVRELARRSGLSPGYVGNLARGFDYSTGKRVKPSVEKLERLARGMRIPTDAVVKAAAGKAGEHSQLNVAFPASEQLVQAFEEVSLLPIEDQEKVLFALEGALAAVRRGKAGPRGQAEERGK